MAGSELVAIFGGELPEVSQSRVGVRIAGDVKASIRDLATALLAVSVAELHARGAATLTQQQGKKLFRTVHFLTVQASGGADGFAGQVAAAARGPVKVQDLANTMLGGRVPSPELTLIGRAQSLLQPSGAVVAKHGMSRLGSKAGFSTPYEVNDQAAAGLRGEWEVVRKGWESWKAANQALAGPLMEACRKAMSEAKEYSSDSGADF